MKLFSFIILAVSFLVSALVFILCGIDKFCAVHSLRRVPEKIFFILSALGGAPGLCFGMIAFHHKTAHISFRFCAVFFGLLWVVLVTTLLTYYGEFIV